MRKGPKIFLFDIETAPNIADVWRFFKTNVGINQVRRNGRMIMWAGKWLHSNEIIVADEIKDGRKAMIKKLHKHMEEADILVGQNGDRFDIRWANTEFLREGLTPPAPSKTIDTLKVMRRHFALPSYKLDYVCTLFGLGSKAKTAGHSLWINWEAGKPKARLMMIRYCIQDVRLLEKLYKKLLPWIRTHPAYGLYHDKGRPSCSNCGSVKVQKRGITTTLTQSYQRYKCASCGTNLRGRFIHTSTKQKRANALVQD